MEWLKNVLEFVLSTLSAIWDVVLYAWWKTFGMTVQMLLTAEYSQLSGPKQFAYIIALIGIPIAVYSIWVPIVAALEAIGEIAALLIGVVIGNWPLVLTSLSFLQGKHIQKMVFL